MFVHRLQAALIRLTLATMVYMWAYTPPVSTTTTTEDVSLEHERARVATACVGLIIRYIRTMDTVIEAHLDEEEKGRGSVFPDSVRACVKDGALVNMAASVLAPLASVDMLHRLLGESPTEA